MSVADFFALTFLYALGREVVGDGVTYGSPSLQDSWFLYALGREVVGNVGGVIEGSSHRWSARTDMSVGLVLCSR